jgi:tetratricopeptide (TPR) repeat protein
MSMKRPVEVDQSKAPPSITEGEELSRLRWKAVILIVCVGAVFYINSFQGAFVFDERYLIVNNPHIHHLWPPWDALFAPINVSRPLVGLSYAVNYTISGLNPWSYHAVNLVIHILAALTLLGIVSRTLRIGMLAKRFGSHSTGLAMSVALIWMVHPLQTQSVTYIAQRCESLMGLFYLATLYCSIRGLSPTRRGLWYAGAIAASACGMLSKQVMVTAPVMVVLYDVTFVAGSLSAAIRMRWRLYVGLAATWIILAAIIIASPKDDSAGFAMRSMSSLDYLKSQFGVIVHYLRLALWPDSMCLDYGWPKARTLAEIIPSGLIIAALCLLTIAAIARRKPTGFVGAWFFLILSVTSSVIPIADLAFEHRMYLPLASVVVLVVFGAYLLGERLLQGYKGLFGREPAFGKVVALAGVTSIVVVLGFLTTSRNIDYRSPLVMWKDVVKKRPGNARGHNILGAAFAERDDPEDAIAQFAEAVRVDPRSSEGHNNLGFALILEGRLEEAKLELIEALRINQANATAHYNLGRIALAQGYIPAAIQEYSQAVQIKPDYAEAYLELGQILEKQGRTAEARQQFDIVRLLRPD